MKNIFYNITAVFQIFVFALTVYYLVISLVGLYKKKKAKLCAPEKSFALIAAAHNEELVIKNLIDSLNNLDYPKELYDIFVIADNCTDNTAKIAAKCGAKVFERVNKEKRGKGFALEWMFAKIFKMNKKYDAIAIFDADNVVSTNFLNEMNSKMCEGYKVVQGYIDSKNPDDSWITEAYSIAFWSANRMFQMGRVNLGLSNQLGGTGFVMATETLKELGWGATCLTEDLEFTCKLVLNGHKVGWAHEAVVYDEKPLTLKQSWHQRKRWMQGFADVASRFFMPLIKKALSKGDFIAFDCALYVIQPFVTLMLAISLVLTLMKGTLFDAESIFTVNALFSNTGWKVFSIMQFLLTPLVMLLEDKINKRFFAFLGAYSFHIILIGYVIQKTQNIFIILLANGIYLIVSIILSYLIFGKKQSLLFIRYLLYGFYTLTWIPITIQGIINKNNKEWNHTKHVRQIGIYDV